MGSRDLCQVRSHELRTGPVGPRCCRHVHRNRHLQYRGKMFRLSLSTIHAPQQCMRAWGKVSRGVFGKTVMWLHKDLTSPWWLHPGSTRNRGPPRAHLHVVGMLWFMSQTCPFYSVLVSISAFMALSTVFHSINSPDNSPVLSLPYWSLQLYVSLWKSPSALK